MYCLPRSYDNVRWSGKNADAPRHTKGYNQHMATIRVKPTNGIGVPGANMMKRSPHNRANRIWPGCFDVNKEKGKFKKGNAFNSNEFVAKVPVPTMNGEFQARLRTNLGMSLTRSATVTNHAGVC
jgi:hypothetical protein